MTFLLIAAAVAVLLVVPIPVALLAVGIALVIWQPWLLLVFAALVLLGVVLAAFGALGEKLSPLWAPVARQLARMPPVAFFAVWIGGWVVVYSTPLADMAWPEGWPTAVWFTAFVVYAYLPLVFFAARRSNKMREGMTNAG